MAGQEKVIASAKHFVGDGGTIGGINENNTISNMHELLSIHMPAYFDSVIKGVSSGVNAGIDMIMVPHNYREFIDGLTSLVKNNFVYMSRIDDAVRRILRVKFAMGLFEHPLADYSMTKYLECQEHKEIAREAVRKSLVLLKNSQSAAKPLLPLPKKASKILITGRPVVIQPYVAQMNALVTMMRKSLVLERLILVTLLKKSNST